MCISSRCLQGLDQIMPLLSVLPPIQGFRKVGGSSHAKLCQGTCSLVTYFTTHTLQIIKYLYYKHFNTCAKYEQEPAINTCISSMTRTRQKCSTDLNTQSLQEAASTGESMKQQAGKRDWQQGDRPGPTPAPRRSTDTSFLVTNSKVASSCRCEFLRQNKERVVLPPSREK